MLGELIVQNQKPVDLTNVHSKDLILANLELQ
jgi:hypothetical protein